MFCINLNFRYLCIKRFIREVNLGQIYTKKIVADFMVSLFSFEKAKIMDPCFGGGVFIRSVLENTNYDITAVEIDKDSFESFENPEPRRCQIMNDSFFNVDLEGYNGIIMNPPYVRHEEIDEMKELGVTKTVLRNACAPLLVPSKANLYMYFILRAALMLPDSGEMIVIFPNTWKQTPDGRKFESMLMALGAIERYITVSGEPFEGNPLVEVCIIKFVRNSRKETEYYQMSIKENSIEINSHRCVEEFVAGSKTTLGDIAIIRRGVSTGANNIFINPSIADCTHVSSILSSPKNVIGYTTNHCKQDKILAIGREALLSNEEEVYLQQCASSILRKGKPLTLKKKIENAEKWYCIKLPSAAAILFSYIIRDNVKFILNEKQCVARDNFYAIESKVSPCLLLALLNNYYVYLQLEKKGKLYGDGMLKIQIYDLKSVKIPNIDDIEEDDVRQLESLARKLVEISDIECIDKITDVLCKYYKESNIKALYDETKERRLQRYGN